MTAIAPPKWKQLTEGERSTTIARIYEALADARELASYRLAAQHVTATIRLRKDAKAIHRLAWACSWRAEHFWEVGRQVPLAESVKIPETDSLLETLSCGCPSVADQAITLFRQGNEEWKQLPDAAEDLHEALNAFLEADFYLRSGQKPLVRMSPSGLRVLDTFDPLRQRNRSYFSPII